MIGRDGSAHARVIVAGGSIAGLFAATLLHRRGHAVDVFERSGEALASRGAGIVSHPELFDALAQAGATLDGSVGVPVVGRITLRRDGTVLGANALPQLMLSWDRLYRLLRAALPDERYHRGRAVEGFDQEGRGVSVRLADGASERADWLIGADGIRSTVRRQLLPELEPAYAGYVAWRGLIEERLMSAAARAILGDRLAFCLPPGEQMLGRAQTRRSRRGGGATTSYGTGRPQKGRACRGCSPGGTAGATTSRSRRVRSRARRAPSCTPTQRRCWRPAAPRRSGSRASRSSRRSTTSRARVWCSGA